MVARQLGWGTLHRECLIGGSNVEAVLSIRNEIKGMSEARIAELLSVEI